MAAFLAIDIFVTLLLASVVVYLIRDRRTVSSPQRVLREYNRLTALSAKASRKGHIGESNVYQESAERLAELAELESHQGEPS